MSALPSDSFLMALASAGLAMHKGSLVADGRIHRYRVEGDKSGTNNGWYALHLDDKPFGKFGTWRDQDTVHRWFGFAKDTLTEAERKAMAARMAQAKAARDVEQVAVYAAAKVRAAGLWEKSHPATNQHPYLVKKGVQAYGIRLLRKQLVIPLRDVEGTLHSLQFIGEDGRKTFLTGGRKRGCYFSIGKPDAALCICEGYATAATIFEATGHATACAFDAGNLEPVARALRGKFPRLRLILCADNDTETEGNPGLRHAEAAARAVGGFLAYPSFDEVAA